MTGNLTDKLIEILILAIPIVIAITFHEAAHGYVARMFGDPTAAERGRLTLNPLKHVDPFGTILLPAMLYFTTGILFGFAKPVPVDYRRLNNPRRDMIWVAAAGPGMNFLLAAISTLLLYVGLHVTSDLPRWIVGLLWGSVEINLMLAVFNLWPIPPLDGSKVAIGALPLALARPLVQLERYGILVVLVIFVVLPFAGLNLLPWMVGRPVDFLERPILHLLGAG